MFFLLRRSTPRRDEVYGGKDDLTAAAGWEEDGNTYIMFRKPVDSAEEADNSFESHLEFIYAYGQANQEFYKPDELKYHGGNRGHKGEDFISVAGVLLACFCLPSVCLLFSHCWPNGYLRRHFYYCTIWFAFAHEFTHC